MFFYALDRLTRVTGGLLCVSLRSVSSRCFGSTTTKHPSRCLRVSGECGSASAHQRPLHALASSYTSLSSTAPSSNSTSHRFLFISMIFCIGQFRILDVLIMSLKAQQMLCIKPYIMLLLRCRTRVRMWIRLIWPRPSL